MKADKARKVRAISTAVLAVYVVALSSLCTQFVAHRFNYHPALGKAYGNLYMPWEWARWLTTYYDAGKNTFNYAFIIFALGVGAGLVAYVLYVGFVTRSIRKHESVHGTAHFATGEEIRKTGLIPAEGKAGKGVYVGAWRDPDTGVTHYLRHDGPEHVAALAPTRSGKGVGLVIPTLLAWPDSVFVYDTKGENCAATSGWRREHASNKILRFDPAEPGSGCAFNPLDEVRFRTRYQVSDAQGVAALLVDTEGKGLTDHWLKASFGMLTGIILHALYKAEAVGRQPSLTSVAEMLSGVGDFAAGDDIADDDDEGDKKPLKALFEEMAEVRLGESESDQEAELVIQATGKQMLGTPSKELGSIVSTATNCLALYRDPIVAKNTAHSDFTVSDLMDHDTPVSLYFVVSPGNKDRLRPLVRLMLTQIVRGLVRDSMSFDGGRAKTAHKHRLLLMLDEFPTLGRLDVFEEALAYIAGYGLKAYLIMQDVTQLHKAYTRDESIISNCHVRAAYAPNKIETAEWLSKMTGTSTEVKEAITTSGKRFGAVLDNVSTTYQEVSRPLLTPDECMRLPGPTKDDRGEITDSGEMLIFVAGQPVIRGRQILYFKDPILSARSKIPPPERSDIIRANRSTATNASAEATPAAGNAGGFVVS